MEWLNWIGAVAGIVGVGSLLGTFYISFRNGRATGLMNIQQQTIMALQQQLELLRTRIVELEKENAKHELMQETIISALNRKGMRVTIDGDMVTISGKDGSSSTVKQQQPKPKITKTVVRTEKSETAE